MFYLQKRALLEGEDSFVPRAGLEPAQPLWPRDFKSLVSTIPPSRQQTYQRKSAAKVRISQQKTKENSVFLFFFFDKRGLELVAQTCEGESLITETEFSKATKLFTKLYTDE